MSITIVVSIIDTQTTFHDPGSRKLIPHQYFFVDLHHLYFGVRHSLGEKRKREGAGGGTGEERCATRPNPPDRNHM